MADPKLIDLKRTKADKKTEEKDMSPSSPMDSDYHYGLRIHLGDQELDKLGMKENPEAGTEHKFLAHARVVRSEHSSDENGERRRVELHIHKMEPPEEIGSGTKKEKSVREDVKDSLRASEEKSEKKAGAKTKGEEEDEG